MCAIYTYINWTEEISIQRSSDNQSSGQFGVTNPRRPTPACKGAAAIVTCTQPNAASAHVVECHIEVCKSSRSIGGNYF